MAKGFPNTGVTTGLASDRTGMTGMVAGQFFFETDTNLTFVYTGSAWVLPWEQKVAEATASGSTLSVSGLSQAGNHMRVEFVIRGTRAAVNTGGRFSINGLSGAADYSILYNNTGASPVQQSIGYFGQMAAGNALSGEFSVGQMYIPFYRNQLGVNRMNVQCVSSSYSAGTFVTQNFVGATSGCGAVTSILLREDVSSALSSLSTIRVFISS